MAVSDIMRRLRPTPDDRTTEEAVPPRVHHVVDVAEGLRPLPTGGSPRVLLTVVDDGVPIGMLELVAAGDPVPVDDQLVAIAGRLGHQLDHHRVMRRLGLDQPSPSPLSVAVVVCTRDRPDDLRRCLESILASSRQPDEILVVDNASADDRTRRVVESMGPRVRYVLEPEAGLDRARNRGLSLVDGEVVLFTDDDVEVDGDWVERLSSCFDDPAVAAACGLVLPARLDNEARDRFERHAGFGRGFHRRVVDPSSTSPYAAGAHGAGASMAFRATTLKALGGFPEELDAGMPTASGGDTYALGEVVRAGYRIVYEPAALAFHHHRSTEVELRRALRGYGTGLGAMVGAAVVRHRDPGAVIVGVPVITRYLATKVARSLLRRPGSTPPALVAAEVQGLLDAPKSLRAARRIAGERAPIDLGLGERSVDSSATIDPGRSIADHQHPVSVVIPSRGRRDRLVELLLALDDQTHPDDLIEYVVVIDGDIDGSEAAVRRLELRRRIRVVVLDAPSDDPHHGNGAGFARNVGARQANNDVLLFLDDDVLPRNPRLIAAHLDHHCRCDVSSGRTSTPADVDIAVVGPCLPTGPLSGHRSTAHEIAIRLWWSDHAQRLVTGQQLDYSDFGTGNVSIRRELFERLGGFANLPRREDWEFGRRLLGQGGCIVAAADAAVFHDADYGIRSALNDRFREGQGDAAMARRDPALVHWSPLAEWSTAHRRRKRLMETMLRASDGALDMAAGAAGALATLDRLGLRHRHSQLKRIVNTAAYWAGVGAELGGEAGWHELRRLADGSGRMSTLRLEDVTSWVSPRPGTVDEVIVTFGDRPLLVAPVSWGDLPWSRTRFLSRVLERAAPLVSARELIHGDRQVAATGEQASS
jgi:glycosyltransferase involved in cell wall biosynthesis